MQTKGGFMETDARTVSPAEKKQGEEKYGDVKYADPKNKKYPVDTEAHVRAAWSYINMPRNSKKYSTEEVSAIKSRIKTAAKKLGIQISENKAKADIREDLYFFTKAGLSLKLLGDRILVKETTVDENSQKDYTELEPTEPSYNELKSGLVLAVGEGIFNFKTSEYDKFPFTVGDTLLYSGYSQKVTLGANTYYILSAYSVIGVINNG